MRTTNGDTAEQAADPLQPGVTDAGPILPDGGSDGGVPQSSCPTDLAGYQLQYDLANGGFDTSESCDANGWCWENSPMGATLIALSAISDDDVWAVGEAGAVVHWDGTRWASRRIPTPLRLYAVWASSPRDVWVGGQSGLIGHWQGSEWTLSEIDPQLQVGQLHGTATDDVWAATTGPDDIAGLYHWNGAGWTRMADGSTTAVFAISRTEVYRTTFAACERWEGSAFNAVPCGLPQPRGIWASGPRDVWIVGTNPCFGQGCQPAPSRVHFDGQGWTTWTDWHQASSITGSGSSDVWIGGRLHFDGASWTLMCAPRSWDLPASAAAGGRLWTLWEHEIVHFDGSTWQYLARTSISVYLERLRPSANGAWINGRSDDAGWGKSAVLAWDGQTWAMRGPSAVFGSSPADLWTEEYPRWPEPDAQLRHWNGSVLSAPLLDSQPGFGFTGWSVSAADAIATSASNTFLWDGIAWKDAGALFGGVRILEFWGGADELWASGQSQRFANAIFRRDASGWSQIAPDSAALNWYYLSNLTGTGPGDAWMLGAPPTGGYRFVTLHWNGSDFDDLRVPPEVELGSIGGDAPDDVWAAVRPPLVPRLFHFDGHEWLETPTVGLPIADLMGIPGVATIAISDRGGLFVRSRQR